MWPTFDFFKLLKFVLVKCVKLFKLRFLYRPSDRHLCYYYICSLFYIHFQSAVINHPSNLVVPGRVIMVKGPGSQAVLGVVLKILAENAPPQFHTLLLCDPFKDETESGS